MRDQTKLFLDTYHKASCGATFLSGTKTPLVSFLSNSRPYQRLTLPISHPKLAPGFSVSFYKQLCLGSGHGPVGQMATSPPPNSRFLTFSETEIAAEIARRLPFCPFSYQQKH